MTATGPSRAAEELATDAATLNQAALILRRRMNGGFISRVIIRVLERASDRLAERAERA